MRFQFITDHSAEFAVRQMCMTLNVSPSGYYAWRTRPPSVREMANQALFKDIETVYHDNDGLYGSPRIHAELKAQGKRCGKNRVARLMRLRHLCARQSGASR
jgi:Na+-transporting NADH:ubiquinone oxidoreductase subunit NqrA